MNNLIIFRSSGRFGNAIFRYLACVKVILKCKKYNIDLNYVLEENVNYKNINNLKVIKEKEIFDFLDSEIKEKDINILLDGYFQHDNLYDENKTEIIDYINIYKNIHKIRTDRGCEYFLKSIIDEIILEKKYDVVIHLRLSDFNGSEDFIELKHMINLFNSFPLEFFTDKKIAIVSEKLYSQNDINYLNNCLDWFKSKKLNITFESNDLITDFNIMKQAKILICSNSTLAWIAVYFSKNIEKCFLPDYNFKDKTTTFKYPIKNTVLYKVN